MAFDAPPSKGPLLVQSSGRHRNHHLSWHSHHAGPGGQRMG